MNTILQINKLTLGYSSKKEEVILAEDITVSAQEGQLIALMGLNGTGKTTLFKTILQEIKPISGEIVVNGERLDQLNISKTMSVVFTERIHLFGFTVFDLVAMGRMPHTNSFGKLKKEDIEIVNKCISLLGLEQIQDFQVEKLSDGQFQKVMIAKSLAQETPLLLLDEPTAFLDVRNKDIIYNLLREITKNLGKTIIVSTHNIEFCKEYCDSFWLLQNNKLTENEAKSISKSTFQFTS